MKAEVVYSSIDDELTTILDLLSWQRFKAESVFDRGRCLGLTNGTGKPVVIINETTNKGFHEMYNYMNKNGLFHAI